MEDKTETASSCIHEWRFMEGADSTGYPDYKALDVFYCIKCLEKKKIVR